MFRHGERNIAEPYPNDPHKDPSNWPDGFGQLTDVSSIALVIHNELDFFNSEF